MAFSRILSLLFNLKIKASQMTASTFYLEGPRQGADPADQPANWLRSNGKPLITTPLSWVEHLRAGEIPCIIVKNQSFTMVGVVMSDRDLQRWVREDQRGRWMAFYLVPFDRLAARLPDYAREHLADQIARIKQPKATAVEHTIVKH